MLLELDRNSDNQTKRGKPRDKMSTAPFRILNPQKYDIATEVLSSAIRILQAVGFSEEEVPKLFEQVARRPARIPLWLEPV